MAHTQGFHFKLFGGGVASNTFATFSYNSFKVNCVCEKLKQKIINSNGVNMDFKAQL